MIDDDNDDNWESSPEEEAQMAAFYQMAERYPTFLIVMKIVHSYTRRKKLAQLEAPEIIVANEQELLDKRLDEFCAAMPYLPDVGTYSLPGIIEHFRAELMQDPGKGNDA